MALTQDKYLQFIQLLENLYASTPENIPRELPASQQSEENKLTISIYTIHMERQNGNKKSTMITNQEIS